MITKEHAYAWMDRQIEANSLTSEPLGGILNITGYHDEIHIFNIEELSSVTGIPLTRSHHSEDTDKLHFLYKGVEFFGITWDKHTEKEEKA